MDNSDILYYYLNKSFEESRKELQKILYISKENISIFNSYINDYFDIDIEVEQPGNTDSIGDTICAFLNTKGGKIKIGYDGDDHNNQKAKLEENLKKSYGKYNRNPSKWISVNEQDDSLMIKVSFPNNHSFFTFDEKMYYRVGKKNKILLSGDTNEILRNRKKAFGRPVLSEYEPTDEAKKKSFKEAKSENRVSYLRIGEPLENKATFYKYISLEAVMSIFRKVDADKVKEGQRNPPQTMRFVEPPAWPDQYERRFYTADYKKVKIYPNAAPKLYATCFTPCKDSEPAWQVYNRKKEGLGARCVQFRFNQVALREELVKNLEDCTIVEGVVDYQSNSFIDELHLSTTKDGTPSILYDHYFSDFTLDNFINLLLLKRTAFDYEKEVRIFLIFDEDNNESKSMTKEEITPKNISLDWLSFIEEIRVDPNCTEIEIALLQDAINRLIEDSNRSQDEKDELKARLIVEKYNVNEDKEKDNRICIGEEYKEYKKRQKNQNN